MGNDSKFIREFMNDLDECVKLGKLNEAYVFNQEGVEQNRPQGDENHIKEPIGDKPEIEISGNGVDGKIEEIRKIAIRLLADLDPGINPESYKLVKGIWDSCDKYLIKDQKAPKQQLNNEIK